MYNLSESIILKEKTLFKWDGFVLCQLYIFLSMDSHNTSLKRQFDRFPPAGNANGGQRNEC